MKRIQVLLSFILILCLIFNLSGCSYINAVNLSADVVPNTVQGKEYDDFTASQMKLYTDLFKAMVKTSKDKNLLVSPLSIQLALSMVTNGADGQTKSEMENLLGNGIGVEELNEYLYSYVNSLPQDEKCKTNIANSIWVKNGLNVKEPFLQKNADYYAAEVYKSAFGKSTLKDVNLWVKEHTDGMIEKIIDNIGCQTVMMLINSVLFEAEWENIYYNENVAQSPFKTYSQGEKQVEMMRSTESRYIKGENARGFIKNYKDAKYSFAAILPEDNIDIYDYVESLSSASLRDIINYSENGTVVAGLPKFSFEYSLTVNEVLKSLGMKLAFDANKADFRKMATSEIGNIYIGEVVHKTNITVDTKGTKAAAVTRVNMDRTGAYAEPKVVILDRPFVFMILDNATNLPIFMGIVTDIGK